MPGLSHDVATLHQAELEGFTTQLIKKSFRPADGDRHNWIGPVHPELTRFTDAAEMRIQIRDGWPYLHPHLFVEGLRGRRHVSGSDNVCLWNESDDSYEWLTVAGIERRIVAWCADQVEIASEPTMDAHLYFEPYDPRQIVIVRLETMRHGTAALSDEDGAFGTTKGRRDGPLYRVDGKGDTNVVWFRGTGIASPPTDWQALVAVLTSAQRAELGLFTRWASARRPRPALVILVWRQSDATAALAIRLVQPPIGSLQIHALEIALTGPFIMSLRAGPDAAVLKDKKVIIFGAGAIGSHVAVLLAKSGVGMMTIVDDQRLRPGDLTRHAAMGAFVGRFKGEAIEETLSDSMIATHVTALAAKVWDAQMLGDLVAQSDVVIDATGSPTYADLLSQVSADIRPERPMLSLALYRRGQVARASVQVSCAVPIRSRRTSAEFPAIPPDPGGEEATMNWETGCGAPVNDAPPWAVASAAALGSRTAIRILTGTLSEDLDLVDVYEPLEGPPFDKVGLRVFRAGGTV